MSTAFEDEQPPEWEALLPSMSLRPRWEKLTEDILIYQGVGELGHRRIEDRRPTLVYGLDPDADPQHQLDEAPPKPWEREDSQLFVRRLLRQLPWVEAQVIRMRWGIGQPEHTQGEICAELGISRSTAYYAERRAFHRMRVVLGLVDGDPQTTAEAVYGRRTRVRAA